MSISYENLHEIDKFGPELGFVSFMFFYYFFRHGVSVCCGDSGGTTGKVKDGTVVYSIGDMSPPATPTGSAAPTFVDIADTEMILEKSNDSEL